MLLTLKICLVTNKSGPVEHRYYTSQREIDPGEVEICAGAYLQSMKQAHGTNPQYSPPPPGGGVDEDDLAMMPTFSTNNAVILLLNCLVSYIFFLLSVITPAPLHNLHLF